MSPHFYKPAAPLGLRCVGFRDFIKPSIKITLFKSKKLKADEASSALGSKMRIADKLPVLVTYGFGVSIKSPLRFRGRLIHCRDSPSLRKPQGSSILSKRRNCSPQCTPATAHYHELKDIKKSMRCHNSVTFSIYTLFTEKDIEMVHGANDRRTVPD